MQTNTRLGFTDQPNGQHRPARRGRPRQWGLGLALFAAVGLLAAACGARPTPTAGTPKRLVVGMKASSIVTLDPANYRDRDTETVIRNLFDGLVTRTPDGRVVPELAESWSNPDPLTWEFKVRQGVKFHDGTEMTVDDVVFTFERILTGGPDGQGFSRKGLLGPLNKVEKVDDQTVRFTLTAPFPVLLQALVHQQIVPKAYVEEVGDEMFARAPIGTGPFQLVSAKLDSEIVMKRFDDYWGGAPDLPPVGPAQLDEVVFRMIPEAATRIAALQNNEVQIIQQVPPDAIASLEADANLQVKSAKGTRVYAIDLNTQSGPLKNRDVRRALNMAVNWDEILTNIYGGRATRLPGAMLPYAFAANQSLTPYPYDPEQAKSLLELAGYADGFSIVIDTPEYRQLEAEAIAEMWRAIGLDASVRVWDWSVLGPLALEGQRQAVMVDWGNAYLDPFDFLNPRLLSGDRGNYSQYANPTFDDLVKRAGESVDLAERKRLYEDAQKIVWDDAPWVFGYALDEIEAARAEVGNWQPAMDSRINLHDVTLGD